MSNKIKVLIVAIVLVVIGALSIAFGDTKGPEPELICAERGDLASGIISKSKDCNVTQESMDKWDQWNQKAQPIKATGVIVIGVGLLIAIAVGVTALIQQVTKKNRKKSV